MNVNGVSNQMQYQHMHKNGQMANKGGMGAIMQSMSQEDRQMIKDQLQNLSQEDRMSMVEQIKQLDITNLNSDEIANSIMDIISPASEDETTAIYT